MYAYSKGKEYHVDPPECIAKIAERETKTSFKNLYRRWCLAEYDDGQGVWGCTRAWGHTGVHLALDGSRVQAVWSDDV